MFLFIFGFGEEKKRNTYESQRRRNFIAIDECFSERLRKDTFFVERDSKRMRACECQKVDE